MVGNRHINTFLWNIHSSCEDSVAAMENLNFYEKKEETHSNSGAIRG